jgi:allophanate hydrolase subunit 2
VLGSIRVLPGPELAPSGKSTLTNGWWEVGTQSNAIGLRLSGPALAIPSYDIQSAPTQDGTVQATQAGLIALLRNRGTLGGYPRVANVIDCDVDRLAQFRPGQQLRFQFVPEAEARRLYELQQKALEQVVTG